MKSCELEGCERGRAARGYCQTHYRRLRKGQPLGAPINPSFQRFKDERERFWAKVDKTGDCWMWTASIRANGYGAFSLLGSPVLAHRYAYEITHGPIPPHLVIDHLCMTPGCVRPDHLEAVTVAENTRRGYSGPIGAARHRAKTHCPQGHPYDEANTYVPPGTTYRQCRTCRQRTTTKETA